MSVGTILLIITILSIILILSIHPFVGRYFRSYWFYFIIAVAYLIYFIVVRYQRDVKILIEISDLESLKQTNPYQYSFKLSKVFLLDLCPFVSIALPISLIVDKTRNSAKVISLFGILGGGITIFGHMSTIKQINISLTEFIFIGEAPNYLMFSSHYIVLIISLIVILNSKKYTKWSFAGMIFFISCFICYVWVVSEILNIQCNTTGLREGDWINPYTFFIWYSEYGFLQELLPLVYPYQVLFWYSIAMLIVITFMIIKNFLTIDPRLSEYKLWWKRLSKIDNKINTILSKMEFKKDFYYI